MGREHVIMSVEDLVAVVGEASERSRHKVRDRLDDDDRRWLAASPLCLLATSDAGGRCDVSPKGDPAGSLVHVVDDHTLALAERPGNRRVDGYRNILENPHVGLVFVVPGRSDTLRVNGTARLVSDAPWFDDLRVQDRRPVLALVVGVEEVFGHCAKSLVRARVWHPETWDPFAVTDVGSSARERRRRGQPSAVEARTVDELERAQVTSYRAPLY